MESEMDNQRYQILQHMSQTYWHQFNYHREKEADPGNAQGRAAG